MMNELIKELAKQATTTEYGVDNGFDCVTFDKEKFAELIVRECSAFVYNYPEKYLTRNQAREISLSMEELFGVEE